MIAQDEINFVTPHIYIDEKIKCPEIFGWVWKMYKSGSQWCKITNLCGRTKENGNNKFTTSNPRVINTLQLSVLEFSSMLKVVCTNYGNSYVERGHNVKLFDL